MNPPKRRFWGGEGGSSWEKLDLLGLNNEEKRESDLLASQIYFLTPFPHPGSLSLLPWPGCPLVTASLPISSVGSWQIPPGTALGSPRFLPGSYPHPRRGHSRSPALQGTIPRVSLSPYLAGRGWPGARGSGAGAWWHRRGTRGHASTGTLGTTGGG